MGVGGDNPVLILPVVAVDARSPGGGCRCGACWPEQPYSSRWWCGVLLRRDRLFGEERLFDGCFNHRAILVLVKLADVEAEVIDDSLGLLAPGAKLEGNLLDDGKARVLQSSESMMRHSTATSPPGSACPGTNRPPRSGTQADGADPRAVA